MYKTHDTNLDDHFQNFKDSDFVMYDYPITSNGFSFIAHMATVQPSHSDKKVVIVTEHPNIVKKELKIYSEQTEYADYNTEFPSKQIEIVGEEMSSKLLELDDVIVIFTHQKLFDIDTIGIDNLIEIQDKNDISIWVCNPYDESLPELNNIADIVIEFDTEVSEENEFERLIVSKHRHFKSNIYNKIDVQFEPYLSIDTTNLD